mgnify:CR=1 FL=1
MFNQLVQVKTHVFCLDLAILLRTISYQAYYDPNYKGIKSASAYEGIMDLKSSGLTLIDVNYNPDHETFCCIAREDSTSRLIVSIVVQQVENKWMITLILLKEKLISFH